MLAVARRTVARDELGGDLLATVRDLELLALVGIVDPRAARRATPSPSAATPASACG